MERVYRVRTRWKYRYNQLCTVPNRLSTPKRPSGSRYNCRRVRRAPLRVTKSEAVQPTRAALACRTHSGWAALVAVAFDPEATATPRVPVVIDRRRIDLADPAIPRPVQPYHQAEKLDFPAAQQLIERAIHDAGAMAEQALRATADELRGRGYEVAGCGVLLGSGRPLPALDAILAAHPLIHTAEGELYRGAIAKAAAKLSLRVTAVRERELLAQASKALGLPGGQIEKRIAEMGRALGPPWRQDQKYAALVAWMALARHGPMPPMPGPVPPVPRPVIP